MKNRIKLEPRASSTIDLMRYNGYSVELAIADIIDNSLPKKVNSKNIQIKIIGENLSNLYVTIEDDGIGMDYEELKAAMHLSAKDLNSNREQDDLGKFGLGLKSASFSQCKNLIVLSKKNGKAISGIEWDLSYVIQENDWSVNILDKNEIVEIKNKYLLNDVNNGTTVIWKNCDYILNGVVDESKSEEFIASLVVNLQKNLSLIYHKYINKGLKIHVNGLKIEAMDPFCIKGSEGTRSTIQYHEKFDLDSKLVEITGYLLPHSSKITGKAKEESISLDGDLMGNQGLYFYRVDRLISWGSWHNLIKKSEANKLARVEVSVGNDLDHLWQIEIKKSSITIPFKLREYLKYLMRNVAQNSDRVGSRRVERPQKLFALWKTIIDKDKKSLVFSVDEEHPLLLDFIDKNNIDREALNSLVKLIGSSFPISDLRNAISQSTYHLGAFEDEAEKKLIEDAMDLKDLKVDFDNYYQTMVANNIYGLESDKLETILQKIKNEWLKS